MTRLTLPFPPSINHYWRHVIIKNRVRVLISKEGQAYRAKVLSQPNINKLRFGAARLGITIIVYPPDRRRRDLDNLPKAALDALTHAGVYEDDCQIDDLRVVRGPVEKGGGLVVLFEVLAP